MTDDDNALAPGEDDSALALMKERWGFAESYWHKTFAKAREDVNLMYGDGGWDADVRAKRESNSLVCLTFNQLKQHANLIKNSFRSEEIGIDVMRTDSDGDEDISDIFEGVARGIEQSSKAANEYRKAYSMLVVAGISWLKICSEWEYDGFDQVLRIEALDDYDSARIDPGKRPEYGFIPKVIPLREFRKEYDVEPAYPVSMESLEGAGKAVIFEYYYLKSVKKMLYLLDDDESMYADSGDIEEVLKGRQIVKQREVESTTCYMRLCTLESFLGEEQETVFDAVPLFPVLGRRVSLDGQVHYEGAFSSSQDPQREFNLSRTIQSEVNIMAPRNAWQAEDKAVEGYENDYTGYMYTPVALLRHRSGYPAPQLIQPRMPDVGSNQQAEFARQDIMASVGRYEATIGEQGNEKSGTAIKARQQSGDLGSQDFKDSMVAAITRLYQVELKAIPKVYDTERMLRIVSKNGKSLTKVVNQSVVGDDGETKIINNLAIGRYDLRVSIGPGYRAQKEEAIDKLGMMTEGDPDLKRRTIDLWAQYSDSPMADGLRNRVEALVPDDALSIDEIQERLKKNAERDQVMQEMGVQNPQVQQMQETIMQMDETINQLQEAEAESEAKISKAKADTLIARLRVQEKELALQVAQAKAEAEGHKAQAAEGALQAEAQKMQRDDEKMIDDAQASAVRQMVERNAQADLIANNVGDNNGNE